MRMLRRLLLLLVFISAIAAAGWWFARPQPVAVVLHEVGRGLVEATLSNTRAGEIEACQRTRMSTMMGGRIEYLGVREGDRVEAGQLLLRLWNEDIGARTAVARAQLDTARRRAGEVCTVAANAKREAERQVSLAARGFVSASRAEQATTDAAARTAACETARADERTAEAQIAAVNVDTGRTELIAPFSGTIAKITGELGEYSTPSPPGVPTPPAIDLIDDSCLYVKAPMDEIDAPRIREGQPVRILLDAMPGRIFEGRVRRIAPYISAVERQARTVDVDIDFIRQEEARGLLVGYSTDVEIVLETRADTLRIPTAALLEGNRVLRYRPDDGRLERVTITPGLANWEFTEVLDGLQTGERIVLSLEREGVGDGALATPDPAATPR
ncbi:MAG: efflux RND transporter periplasmic adaptor subunit [Rhodocyclaceae bacterium]|nr:efflux RND transporter periplasmic adaptor subunit [Rhodocyclaceae bacterium]